MEAFDDLEDGNDGNSIVTEGTVIAGGSSDNVLINPFQNLGEAIRVQKGLIHRLVSGDVARVPA